ncbi:unnamed protein product [Somion occarium]|uniref:Uncharacterized protein n=1 Tax=Somion occarium TaxID=3059160 RepID=A0ABP1D6E3_9APHY
MSVMNTAKLESPPPSPVRSSLGSSKRNSHHRRRSSVSTRHESAEMMGIALPAIPVSSDDNINLGDKDSIRRRALWTLEGKTDVGTFSKVDIPEIDTPECPQRPFEFPTKPSYPPGVGAGFGGGLSSIMGNKRDRDSFGKFMSSSGSIEQLGTLLEEEEEEEDNNVTMTSSPVEEVAEPTVVVTTPSPAPVRHRPASLNLKPLALASSQALSYGDLPTPSPSPNVRSGLRSLTLTTNPDPSEETVQFGSSNRKRHSMMVTSTTSASATLARRPSLNISSDVQSTVPSSTPIRRTSISYHSSSDSGPLMNFGLPTPDMTPISEKRYSSSSMDSDYSRASSRGSRPLSVTEQHFLFQAHQTLVQRISDLERALSARPRSRPQSYASDVSAQSEPPSDEMLQLIADLKSERDELKRDVDGWRARLADSEKQLGVLMRRVENERRDAWVARERVGLLEIEKSTLQKTIEEKTAWGEDGWNKYHDARSELDNVRQECMSLQIQVQQHSECPNELSAVQEALRSERSRREELERELEVAGLLATPTPRTFEYKGLPSKPVSASVSRPFARRGGLGFRSIDSAGSFTDVESLDGTDRPHFELKAVQEEDETDSRDDATDCSDNDNELAGYEDEDENDAYAFNSSSSASSLGSIQDMHRQVNVHSEEDSFDVPPLTASSRCNSTSPSPLPSPEPGHVRRASLSKTWTFPLKAEVPYEREIDEIDRFFGCLEDVDDSPPLGRFTSAESGKNIFSQALGQEVEGGIIFTFNPPPFFEGPEDASLDSSATSDIQPSTPSSRSSPSSIPRPTTTKSFTLSPVLTTPVKPVPSAFAGFSPSSFSTPPSRWSPSPTSIPAIGPRPSTSVSPPVIRNKPASFLPQPRRSSPVISRIPVPSTRPTSPLSKASTSIIDDSISAQPNPVSEMKCDVQCIPAPSTPTLSLSSPFNSPTLAARLSHTLTNFIPVSSLASWSPLSSKLTSPVHMYNIPTPSDPVSPSGDTYGAHLSKPFPRGQLFVSKEKQLEKLRLRLEAERRIFDRHRSAPIFTRNISGSIVQI